MPKPQNECFKKQNAPIFNHISPPPLSTEQSQSIKIAITKSGEKGNSVPNKGHRLIEMSEITDTMAWRKKMYCIINATLATLTSGY